MILDINFYTAFYWLSVAEGVKQFFDYFSNFFTVAMIGMILIWVISQLFYIDANPNEFI